MHFIFLSGKNNLHGDQDKPVWLEYCKLALQVPDLSTMFRAMRLLLLKSCNNSSLSSTLLFFCVVLYTLLDILPMYRNVRSVEAALSSAERSLLSSLWC